MYEPISNKVTDQLNARKSIVEKKAGRTDLDLKYLTSNTGWVMLSSGVNTLTSEEEELLLDQQNRNTITGDPSSAKNTILMGGTTQLTGTLSGGISETGNNNPAYKYYAESTGYRPMTGIVGLSVESKNTFGTLREAEVKIIAWSLEEFEKIERLYLRPGFTMLLEWGHSFAIDNKSKEIAIGSGIFNEGFFRNDIKRTTLQDYIQANREKYSQNYEAMLGYVKNFSWKYLPSGGYECTVNIISTGEILDSLKFNINPRTRGITDAGTGDVEIQPTVTISAEANLAAPLAKAVSKLLLPSEDSSKKELKSPYHYFFEKLKQLVADTAGAFGDKNLTAISNFTQKLQPFTGYHIKGDHSTGFFSIDETVDYFWLPLRVYLDIFNNYITLVDSTQDPKDKENRPIVKFNIDYEKSSKILTVPEQFSIDPNICLLQTNHSIPTTLSEEIKPFFGRIKGVHEVFATSPEHLINGYSDVLNILIPTLYFEKVLDAALAEDYENSKAATEIFQEILTGINTALGGINELDLHYDEDSSTFFVVDRNNTPQDAPPPELDLIGLSSIFTDISIDSKLTNRTGTMVAVAAQGASQSYTDNIDSLLKWNKGVVDRVHRLRGTAETAVNSTAELEAQKIKDWENWYEDVAEFFEDFGEAGIGGGYLDEQKENAKTLHSEYVKYFLYRRTVTTGTPSQNPIPVELSLQLEGISGLKIGNTFRIKKGILPSYYDGRFGYIITGLSHTVAPGRKWFTNIKSQFFIIEKSKAINLTSSTSAFQDPATAIASSQLTPFIPFKGTFSTVEQNLAMQKALQVVFGKSSKGTESMCARYSAEISRLYLSFLKNPNAKEQSLTGKGGQGGGNANSIGHRKLLIGRGYLQQGPYKLTGREINTGLQTGLYNVGIGDVVIYYDPTVKFSPMHSQIFTNGQNGDMYNPYASYLKFNPFFVYKKHHLDTKFIMYIMKSPG